MRTRAHIAVGQLEPARAKASANCSGSRRNAARSSRRPGRSAATGRWSAWSAHGAWRDPAGRARCRRRHRPWFPLVRAGRALGQFPLVLEQVLEEVVVPLRRRGGPVTSSPLVMASRPLPVPKLLFQPGPVLRGRPLPARGPRGMPGRRRGSCRRYGRRRSVPRFLHRPWPCARRSRGCRARRRPGQGCRSGLPG